MRILLRIFLGVLMLIVSSCSSVQQSKKSEQSYGDMYGIAPAEHVDSQAVEKMDHILLYPEVVAQALQKAARQCMVSQGFSPQDYYWMMPRFPIRSLVAPVPLTIENARAYGYENPHAGKNPISEESYSMSEQEADVYYGTCHQEALRKVFGTTELGEEYTDIAQQILPYVNSAADSEPAITLDQEWSLCMKDTHGVEYETPSMATHLTRNNQEQASQTALWDAECREKVKFEERTEEILDAYMTTFLNDHQPLLERIAQAKKNAEENAPKILDGTL